MAFGNETIGVQNSYPDDNPKSVVGITKPPINLIPPTGIIVEAMAFKFGASKYGPFNWREKGVAASIYYAAMMRHLFDWWDGEDLASDSSVHHLGHLRAGANIILDAAEIGKLVDDRPAKGNASGLIERLTIKS